MVDHRRTLGESGRGYLCYILKSPAAVDEFSGVRPSTGFQVHGHQRWSPLYYGYGHMASTIGQWPSCSAARSHESPSSVEHCIAGVSHV